MKQETANIIIGFTPDDCAEVSGEQSISLNKKDGIRIAFAVFGTGSLDEVDFQTSKRVEEDDGDRAGHNGIAPRIAAFAPWLMAIWRSD